MAIGYKQSLSAAEMLAAEISNKGGIAYQVSGDIKKSDAVEEIFADIEAKFGHVSVLGNNAAIRDDGVLSGLTDESWHSVIETNLTAVFRTCRRAIGPMIKIRNGRIINISSFVANHAIAGISNYAASKAALNGLTRALSVEVAHRGVTVNAVAPGLVSTDLTRNLGHFEASVHRAVPMRRPAELTEIADSVSFLASNRASYITGQTLTVDGGLSAMAFSLT